jgi:hypothetical protein
MQIIVTNEPQQERNRLAVHVIPMMRDLIPQSPEIPRVRRVPNSRHYCKQSRDGLL